MRSSYRQSGFTLIEALLLVMIVGIVGVAAGVGLQSVAKTPVQTDQELAVSTQCVSLMEQMRATPFTSLGAKATALSGTATINGLAYTCTVTVQNADADGDGNADPDFDVITVKVGSKTLTCYMVQQ